MRVCKQVLQYNPSAGLTKSTSPKETYVYCLNRMHFKFAFLVILSAGIPAMLAMPVRVQEDLETRGIFKGEYRNDGHVMAASDSFKLNRHRRTRTP